MLALPVNWKRQPSSAPALDQNLPPKPTSSLECAVAPAQVCDPLRMNTCRTQRKNQKTRSFKSCICNTYTPQLCKPFRFNTCKKHGGWGGPTCGKPPHPARRALCVPAPGMRTPEERSDEGSLAHRLSTAREFRISIPSTVDCYSFSTGRSTAIEKCASRFAPSSSCSHRTAQ